MKIFGNILIICGAAVLIFVGVTQATTYYKQKRLLEAFEELPFQELNKTDKSGIETINKINEASNGFEGILTIPAIKLEVPIVEGTTGDDLRFAVGHFQESGEIGIIDENYAIAGHRSHTYGRFFNRLDDLKPNDEIQIRTNKQTYTYKVYDKTIVKPSNVAVLEPIKGKSIVTLITCHPMYSSEKRLVVFAEKVNKS